MTLWIEQHRTLCNALWFLFQTGLGYVLFFELIIPWTRRRWRKSIREAIDERRQRRKK